MGLDKCVQILEYIYTIKLGFINPNLYKDDTSMRILKMF